MSDTNNAPPAEAPQAPADEPKASGPPVLGDLTPDERDRLDQMRRQSDQFVYQMGQQVVGVLRTFGSLEQLDHQARTLLQQIGKRIGIPDGTAWSVTQDGKAILMPSPGGPQQPVEVPAPPEE